MSEFFSNTGSVRLTGDGVIGVSGKPIRVFTAVSFSGAGGNGDLVLRNGTSDTATAYITESGASSHSKIFTFGEKGLLFPNGCFFDKDTHIDAVVVEFRIEK